MQCAVFLWQNDYWQNDLNPTRGFIKKTMKPRAVECNTFGVRSFVSIHSLICVQRAASQEQGAGAGAVGRDLCPRINIGRV
jgi:hypothetical protein